MTEPNSYQDWRDEQIANAEQAEQDQPAVEPATSNTDTDNGSDDSK